LYYPDPLVDPPNIRVDPSIFAQAHEFQWCPDVYHIYSDGKELAVPLGFSGIFSGEWELQPNPAFFQVGNEGLISTMDGSPGGDADHFWVCKVDGIFRVIDFWEFSLTVDLLQLL